MQSNRELRSGRTNGNAQLLSENNFFIGKGPMAGYVNAKDWSKTPLGPIENWPQSLKTTVSLCLASNFPISIAWGPERTQIYNDGYWPLCGDKHPVSMGQDYRECWASAWPVLGEDFDAAVKGETRFLENQRMFLDRYGYLEETFFTFSFSPILDESGSVGGLFHPVTELTQQTLGERRLGILSTLAANTVNAKTVDEATEIIVQTLRELDLDLPFVLMYSLSQEDGVARFKAGYGITKGEFHAPPEISLNFPADPVWPFKSAMTSGNYIILENLDWSGRDAVVGPYPESPKTALVVPLYLPGSGRPHSFLVAGVSARRALDEKYTLFYNLLLAAVTNALAKAQAFEEEKKRTESLLELDRAKTTFFSNISHEFRTPLTLMLGPLEDALSNKQSPLSPEHKVNLALVQRNAFRLQRLVNSLLDFSRIEAGRFQANFYRTDLGEFTGQLSSIFQSAFEKAGLYFNVHCHSDSDDFYIDHQMWEKIVFNLLSNALKFTFTGGVEVNFSANSGGGTLVVKDTGEGVSKEELGNLFKRFHRVEGARSRSIEGSGIGLALVQELIRIHGGSIEAESRPGSGTSFIVRIPKGSGHLPADQIRAGKAGETEPTLGKLVMEESLQWTGSGRKEADQPARVSIAEGENFDILVVDDNEDMREYVARILAQVGTWSVYTATDGEDALAVLATRPVDMVISDIMMPKLDGFGLLKALRSNPATLRTPLIFLSARAGEEATLEGLQLGADDYLVKPFSARELVARVNTQLQVRATKKSNAELTHLSEELRQAAADLKIANEKLDETRKLQTAQLEGLVEKRTDQLRRSNEDLQQFAHVVSHDLKEPVRKIKIFSERLLDDTDSTLSEKGGTYLNKVSLSADRMFKMIEGVLNFSSVSGMEQPIETVSLSEEFALIRTDLELLIQQKNAEIICGELPVLAGSRVLLYQLFYNLISNSLKFTSPARTPEIKITSRILDIEGQKKAEIIVADNGIGFDMANQEKIFQTFSRLNSREHFEGTGLGLSLCRRIAQKHGGDIVATGRRNEGAKFTITLPLEQQDHVV